MTTFNTRVTFDHVRNTEAGFAAANPILGYGVIGLETDSGRAKIGDGVTAWNTLVYFTGQIDWAGITDKPSTFTPSTHNHDDRYYTESETDTLLAGKQAAGSYVLTTDSRLTDARTPTSHQHPISDVTGLQTALDGKQASGSYAAASHTHTIANVTGLQSALDGKQAAGSYAASVHTHGISDVTGLQTALDAKATPSDVTSAITAVVGAAPAALDTLQELAAALNNDSSFASTVTTALAGKAAAVHTHVIADVTGLQTALDGKQAAGSYAAAVHTHGISDVTGLQTALDGKQASGSYAAATHSHAIADVTGLQTALDGKASLSHAHSAADTTSGTFDIARLPVGTSSTTVCAGNDARLSDARTPTAHASSHGVSGSDPITVAASQVSGLATVATSGSYNDLANVPSTFAPSSHTHDDRYYTESEIDTLLAGKQASGTYATLVSGTIPSSQLPSYVDDVIEASNVASLPPTGEVGKIYVATDSNKTYRWSGTTYVEISASPGSTDAVSEGSVNLYFTTARASAAAPVQSVAGRTGNVTIAAADVSGLGTLATQSGTFSGTSSGTNTGDQTITLTGDVTGSGTGTFAATIANGSITDAKIATAGLSASSVNWVGITAWAPSTAYAKGDLVEYLGIAYRRSAAGTSGATFTSTNWQQVTPTSFVVGQLPTVLEKPVSIGNTGTSTTISLANGSVQTATLNGNCTFTMPTATAGASLTLVLTQSGTNTATFTGVKWPGGIAPTITAVASAIDVLVFVSDGTNWYGVASQKFS